MSVFFFSSRRRHTRFKCDWSSDVCSSDLIHFASKRITINPGAIMDVDLGLLSFPTGQQTFHIVARVFDGLHNLPVALGPVLLGPLMVTATDITQISNEDAFLSKRVAALAARKPAD